MPDVRTRWVTQRTEGITMHYFEDRSEAGRMLADRLQVYAGKPGVVVLGLARGGIPVASEVARQLGATLDVLVVRKLGVPCQEELAMGAIAPDGVCVLNDDLIDRLGIESDAIGAVRWQQEKELQRRELLYRGKRSRAEVRGRTVIVIDDGIATGATMHAAVSYLRRQHPEKIVVAAAVIAPDTFQKLNDWADDVVAVTVPEKLRSVGEWFRDFSQTTDDEVQRLLRATDPARKDS